MNEKSPIDNLFARKLRGAEVQPAPDAWARLQAKQSGQTQPLRRAIPLWYYMSAAACLLLIGLGTWIWWQNQSTAIPIGPSIAKRIDKTSQQPTQRTQEPTNQQARLNDDRIVTPAVPVLQEAPMELARIPRRHGVNPTEITPTAPVLQQPEPIQVAVQTEKPVVQLPRIAQIEPAKSEIVVPNTQQAVERTLIVTIAAPVQSTSIAEAVPESKPSGKAGLGKFLGKLKRIKNGEAFARNDIKEDESNVEPHSRFGRIYNDVKESLKNTDTNN